MNPGLKRIETTLQELKRGSTSSRPKPSATHEVPAPQTKSRTYSFEISGASQKRNPLHQQILNEDTLHPVQKSVDREPKLPQLNTAVAKASQPLLKVDELEPPRNDAPCRVDFVLNRQPDVATYRAQLQEIVHQIQDLYQEGPIVDGWLESYPRTPEPRTVSLSHESVDQLIDYVGEVYRFEQGKVTCESPRPGYRLCGLDASGQKWSRPCPLEQLTSVSIAIGRYQRLRQLLDRKQYLELLIASG